ncbi:thioredoxin-like protein [Spinellus fusiger]|nr:thioredoxin-like protein [Spinellus fusiger]
MYFLRWVGCLSVLAICYAQLIQVTDENFNELMKGGDEWLLEFYAPWCHHCQLFENSYRALDHQLKSGHKQVRLGQVDTEANPFLAARFFISRLPTLAHIKDKQGNRTRQGSWWC